MVNFTGIKPLLERRQARTRAADKHQVADLLLLVSARHLQHAKSLALRWVELGIGPVGVVTP